MEINFDDAIGEYVTKIGEKIRETREEFILESLMPYAQTVERRIDKESLSKAIRMYYGKDVQEVRHGRCKFKILDNFRKVECTCTHCGWSGVDNYDSYVDISDFEYCPYCGAKMDLEEKENG